MRLDEVGDPLLDVWPDRRLFRLARLVRVGGGRTAELAQILHRHDHRQIEPLGGRRLDDLHLPLRREEPRHFVDRTDRRRQADPPCRTRQQLVETLQRQGEMGAPLRTGHCMHLVENHRLDPGQGLPSRGGQHQEQRLGGGDQDVRRPGRHRAALGGRCVPRADAHPHVGLGQPEPHRFLADPGQR